MMQTKGNNYYQRYSVSNHNHRQHGCCSNSSNVIHIMIMCLLITLMVTFIIIYQFQSNLFDNTPTYSSTVTMPSSMMINKQQQRLDSAYFSSNTKSSSSNYTTIFDKFKRNILMNHLNGPVDYNKYPGTTKVSRGFYKDSNTIIELNEHSYRSIHDTSNSGSDKDRSSSSSSSSSGSSSQYTHPYMIVFYASWCGHCKSFVKPYSLIVTDVISEVNQRNLNIYYSNEVSHRTRYFRKQHDSKHSSIDSSNGNDIGNGNDHGMDQVLIIYDTPVFAAINCVDYNSICEENKVTSYPTIIFYNFHNTAADSRGEEESNNNNTTSSSSSISSTPSSDLIASSSNDPNQYRIEGGRVSAISKFIKGALYSRSSMVMITRKEFVEKYGHLINAAAASIANNGSSMVVASVEDSTGVVPLSLPHISHTTTPDLRWHDSIASLLYMLSHELPADLEDNPQAKEAILGLLRTLLYLFPSRVGVEGFDGLKSMLQQIVDIVDSNLKDSKKLKDSIATDSKSVASGDVVRVMIIKVINNFRNSGNIQQFQWMTCGVTSSSKQQQPSSSSSSDSTTKSISSNKLRGAEVDGIVPVPVVTSIEARPHDDVGEGYTCGLWMLFHYLTVSSSMFKNIDSSGINVIEVVHVIVDTVTHLFGCMDCRKHFIGDYEACKFDVCHLSVDDYSELQLWLFHQHNSVTYRINAERHHQPINGFTKQSINLPVWPSEASTECRACMNSSSTSRNVYTRSSYDRSIFIDKHVLQYLKQSYSLA